MEWNRRRILGAGAGAGAAIALGSHAALAAVPPARWAVLMPGFLVLLVKYLTVNKIFEKYGVTLSPAQEYTSVSTYYNDFAAGNYEMSIGSWDVYAARYQAGVPVQLLCGITTADLIFILTGEKDIKSVSDLRGKTIAAPQATGTYRLVSALAKEVYGLQFGTDVKIQGVDNPAASMTLVLADRADAGLSWEPNISAALKRRNDLRIIFNAGAAYREIAKADLPYFAVSLQRDWAKQNPEQVKGLRKAFAECLDRINADPDTAVSLVGNATGFPPDAMSDALKTKRLGFKYADFSDPKERENITKAAQFMVKNGLLTRPLDEGFFVPS